MALPAYRNLLRAARIAFQGDNYVLTAAFAEARRGFEANRGLEAGGEETRGRIKEAEDVAKVLRKNVVQGVMGEDGRYKLRIHEGIERGDNETIKMARGTVGVGGKGCCSS